MRAALLLGALAACLLAGCEKPQTAGTRKADGKPWQGAQNGYVAAGWKAGDEASWDRQLRSRADGQNEYTRTPAVRP